MPRPRRSTPTIMRRAGELRKEPTPAERKLWAYLRGDKVGVNFRRQHAIGNYIPDFCSPEARLIIELDGSQHLEQEEYDEEMLCCRHVIASRRRRRSNPLSRQETASLRSQ